MSDPSQDDPLLDAISNTLPALLNVLEALGFIARHLHPPVLSDVLNAVGEIGAPLQSSLADFEALEWPEHLTQFHARVTSASEAALKAIEGLEAAKVDPNGIMGAYKALGYQATATEALYPIARMLPPVNRFFLSEADRQNEALLQKLENANIDRENVGVMHANNERKDLGGFSVYVPEYYDETESYPLIMALHGGSGHGRSFLWSWLKEARGRGAILVSPTSVGPTWSLTGPDVDTENLSRILGFVKEEWNVDENHVLLTGMSDGGTFSYVSGLLPDAPYTHLAPFSASFHPMLLEFVEESRIKDLPIYLSHGALDWMFPVDIARTAHKALKGADAAITYSEVADLSHTYGREENAKIMDWFLGAERSAG